MPTTKNTQSGERLSFYKLFKEKNYRVLIPIIQRDYAQGRKNKKEVRETFLAALYQYLEKNIPNRDLDFVYGSLSKVDDKTDFIPLDGQQRLTTLFLLHWYLYQIQDNKNSQQCQDFKLSLLNDNKSMFTYETRTSSSDFCDALMNYDLNFNHLLPIQDENEVTKENQLSKTIENSVWYFLSWKQDPTIQSMLTMLDAIHNKFADKKEFFERLLSLDEPIITFQFLNLKDFKLSDDLYIKMNSRGKPLTPFENFKAKFEQYLNTLNLSTNRKFQLTFNKRIENVSLNKYFSYNIDTKWANLFWNYRELVGDENIYDEELKNFIRVIFANQYATSVQIVKVAGTEKTDDTFEFLLGTAPARKRVDYTDDISFYKYDDLKALSENSVLYLIDALDNLVNGNDKLKACIPNEYKFYYDEENIFENALKYSFTNNQERIMFHAYIRFLIVNKNKQTGIEQWMRIIHNLAYNTVIDGAPEVARAIKSIDKMLPESNNILDYIITNEIEGFASWQIMEEKVKAHLILKSNDWKSKIEETEKHVCFDGQIGFILEFAGIIEYYNENNHRCDWTNDRDYFERFVNYSEKAVAVFEYRNSETYNDLNTCDFLLERAVMTKGVCVVKSSQYSDTSVNRLNLLHTNVIGNNIARDYSWKRFLRIDGAYATQMGYLQKLFDDNRFDKTNIEDSLISFLQDKTEDWRDYFIKDPSLMKYCRKGFIKVDSENEIYLLASIYKGSNQYFAEMHTYSLWKKHFEGDNAFQNFFSQKWYWESKSYEEWPCISMQFCYKRIHYEIDIYWNATENKYEIDYYKIHNNSNESDYTSDIQELLKNTLGFEWQDDDNVYILFINNSMDVKTTIEEICSIIK